MKNLNQLRCRSCGTFKFDLKMKITTLLLLVTLFQIQANTYSQKTKISIDLKNTSVGEVLKEIESLTEFKFFVDTKQVDLNRIISVKANKEQVSKILEKIFIGTNVTFKVRNKQIILNPTPGTTIKGIPVIKNTSTIQDQIEISGKITDDSGVPLPGVNIIIEGTVSGTETDFDGNFTIEVPGKQSVLVFSSIGFLTQKITIGDQTSINIVMATDISSLEEVVVTVGYGTRKLKDVTGSMVNMNTEKTQNLPNTNILQSLKGSVSGLTVITPDRPGEEPAFMIRGRNSITASNRPLIVLDGIIYNGSLNDIDNGDIESVDVLKDASAAAIYGSRSANGVILITTKRGTSEKPIFNFRTSWGLSNPVSLIPVLDPDQYLQKILDYRTATGQEDDPANISDYLTVTESNNLAAGKTIDWYDELVQTALTQIYSGSVSGATERTNYYLSSSYFNQDGIVQGDDFERFTVRYNMSNKITDWFNLSVKSSYTYLDYSGAAVPLSYGLSPYSNWYEGGASEGELEYYPMEDPSFRHPLLNLGIDDFDKRTSLWGLVSGEFDIPFIEGLKYTMNFSVNQRINRRYQFSDNTLAITANGRAYKQNTNYFQWNFDNIFNYNRTFKNVHAVSATFLLSSEYNNFDQTYAESTNFFNQALGYNSLELGTVPAVSSAYSESSQTAVMGRVNYIYDDRYAITGTIRRDGFSGFAQNNKYATFYSGAFSWTLSNEKFMLEASSWMDFLKLRLSYGENGNQAIGPYQTLARIDSGANYVFGDGGGTSNGVYVSSMANNELGWETTNTFNTGLDFGFLNSKLYGSIDIYSSSTENLLVNRTIPSLTGYTSVLTNIGEVSNKGFELSLNSQAIKNDNWRWDIGLIFFYNRNEIVSLFGEDVDGDGIEDDDIANSWFIGEPLGVFYGYGIDGIHQTGDTDIPSGYQPGDFRIVDYDGDGELTADDRHIIGNNNPNYQFSISNTLKFKNWSLYAMINSIQGGGGNNYYIGDNRAAHNPTAPSTSWSSRFSFPQMDYWTPTNPSNTASRITYEPTRGHGIYEDRSFVRIQDVNLSYTFPKEMMDKWKVDGLQLYLSGKNLYTWSDWEGYDPENATTIYNVPMLRTFTFGIDFKF